MEIDVKTVQGVTVVELAGELTSRTSPDVQRRVLAEARPGGKMVLDMSRVTFVTSAGYRVLLVVYRAVSGKGGRAVLVGLTADIKDTLRVIGFLDFFTHHDTLEAGVADLNSGGA